MPTANKQHRRRRILAAMGIDVWVRRGRGAAEAAGEVAPVPLDAIAERASTLDSTSNPVPRRPAAAQTEDERGAVRIDVVALAGPGGVVVAHLESAEDRRVAQGVFMALGGAEAEPKTARFQWPPSAAMEPSPGVAASAYRAFLKGQIDRAEAACLVLLGDPLMDVNVDLESIVAVPVVRAPSARQLRSEPGRKRQLWRTVAHIRQKAVEK